MTDVLEQLRAALTGRYTIDRKIGQGGMATVYLAQDERHQRDVAIKVLRPDLAAALGSERFLREIRIAANLPHPHILPLYDSGEADGLLYYVMPFIHGETLRQRIDREVELPVNDAIRIIIEVVDALAFAHSKGVVHRDIKPDNVMVTGGHALVADFGVAKAVSEATGRDKLTTAGVALGTPAYMAPEQASADPLIDHRADIYAVGVMAYEMLAGRPLFTAATPQAILAAHVTEQPTPLSQYRDQVPAQLESVIMRCLAKKPADRWQSANEMQTQLEAIMPPSGGMTPAGTAPITAVSAPSRPARTTMMIGIAAVIVGVVAVATLFRDRPLDIVVSNERSVTSSLGLEFEPSLSPDGGSVVYSRGHNFKTRPYVQVLSGGASVLLGEELQGYQREPVWNATGDSVYFWSYPEVGAVGSYRVSAMLGGAGRRMEVGTIRGKTAWSPDGTKVVFVRNDTVFVRGMASGRDTPLLVDPAAHSFAWSPDMERLAYVSGADDWGNDDVLGDIYPSAILVVRTDGSADPVEVVSGAEALNLNASPVWLPDNRHLLFVSDREATRAVYAVEVSRRGAASDIRRLPGGVDPHSIAISADGKRLAYSRFSYARNIFEFDVSGDLPLAIDAGRRITSGTELIERVEISPDNEWIAFDSHINGNHDVFKMRRDGTGRTQLTSDLSDNYLRKWSPDGEELTVTARIVTDTVAVYALGFVNADGSGDIRSFNETEWGAWGPQIWSPSGLGLLLGALPGGEEASAWLASRESPNARWSDPVELVASDCNWPDWSVDAELFLCSDDAGTQATLHRRTGELVRTFRADFLPIIGRAQFSPDNAQVYTYGVTTEGVQGIWSFPTAGGDPQPVILNEHDVLWANLFSFEVGPDGKVYLAIASYESDIWVMDLEW